MKKVLGKFLTYIVLASMVFNSILPFLPAMEVKAKSLDLRDVLDGFELSDTSEKISLDIEAPNNERKLTLKEDSGYSNISCYGYSSNFDITNDEGCVIRATNYGHVEINIMLDHDFENQHTIILDAKSQDYAELLIGTLPDEKVVNKNADYSNILDSGNDDFTINPIPIEENNDYAIYNYSVSTGYDNPVLASKDVKFIFSEVMFKSVFVDVGQTKKIESDGYNGIYSDLYFASQNNSIATIDQKGQVTGVSEGSTKLKIYNKITNEYYYVEVGVSEPWTPPVDEPEPTAGIDAFIDHLKDNIEIDISKNYGYSTEDLLSNYIWSNLNKYAKGNIPNLDVSCEEGVCSVDLDYSVDYTSSDIKNYKFTTTVSPVGVRVGYNNFQLGDEREFYIEESLEEGQHAIITFDPEYFEDLGEGIYRAIKVGKTYITATYGEYTSTEEVIVSISSAEDTILNNYLNSLKYLNLPYQSTDFSNGYADLAILEKVLTNKIINEYPTEGLREYLGVKVSCINANLCNITLNMRKDDTYIFFDKRITTRINYESLTNKGSSIKAVEVLEDKNLTTKESIELGLACGTNNDCIKSYVLDLFNLEELLTDLSYDISVQTEDLIKDYITGSINLVLTIKDNNVEVLTKHLKVNTSYILSVENAKKQNTSSQNITVITDYLNTKVGEDNYVVSYLNSNIYQVELNSKSFNILVDQREIINATGLYPKDNIIILNIGDNKKITYTAYPEEYTNINLEFYSSNPNVATVDENGVLTAIGKGQTNVELVIRNSNNNVSSASVLVLVEETKDTYLSNLLKLVPNTVVVDYSYLAWCNIGDAIVNTIYNINEMNAFAATALQVDEENGKYYAYLSLYDSKTGQWSFSPRKEIKYTLEGIKVDKNDYSLKVGDVVDTKLGFTKGSKSFLDFDIWQDKNNPVVSYNIDGTLKALNPGYVDIYLHDKYNKYYNRISVYVEVESVLDKYKGGTIEIDARNIDKMDNDGVSMAFMDVLRRKDRVLESFMSSTYGDECDINTNKCVVDFTSEIGGKEINFYGEYDIEIKGIHINHKDNSLFLDRDQTVSLDYQVFESNPNVTITSLNPDICSINDGNVTGVNTGLCQVQFETANSKDILFVAVDIAGIYAAFQNALDSLDETQLLNAVEMEFIAHYDSSEYYGDAYYTIILNKFTKLLKDKGLSNFLIEIDADLSETLRTADIGVRIESDVVLIDGFHRYFSDWNYANATRASRDFNFNYTTVSNEVLAEANEILSKIEDKYTLSVAQSIKYRLEKSNFGKVFEYSDLIELLNEYPEYSFEFDARAGTMGEDLIEEYGYLIVYHNDIAVGTKTCGFISNLELERAENETQEQYIENIKYVVGTAYNDVKEELDNSHLFRGFGLLSTFSTLPEVTVTYKMGEGNIGYYLAEVEDIKVGFPARVNENGSYITEAEDIKVSKTAVTVNMAAKTTITATVLPNDATDKNVTWTTSNAKVATVSKGVITGVGTGTATITVKHANGLSKKITVTVKNPLTSATPVVKGKYDGASHTLTITKVAAATGYEIWQASTKTGKYKLIKTTTSLSNVFKYALSTTKYYKVRAYNTDKGVKKYSKYSAIVGLTTKLLKTTAKAASAGHTSNKITITKVAGATGYKIYRATSKSGKYKLVKTTKSLTYTDTKKTTGKTYYYKVRAYKGKKYGAYSSIISAKPIVATPTLKGAKASKTSVKLTFNKPAGTTGYEVYRSDKSNGTYKLITTTKSTTYTNSGLKTNTVYYYKIRAYKLVKGKKLYSNYSKVLSLKAY